MNPLVAAKRICSPVFARLAFQLVAGFLVFGSAAMAATGSSVTLAWNANSEGNLAGYRLLYGTTSGVYPISVDAGNTTTATASGLNPGQTYYFAVVAYNSAGQTSPPSAQVMHVAPGTPNTAPSATAFALRLNEDTQIPATLVGADAEGDSLVFTVATQPTRGTLTGTPPNLIYRPNANFSGNDSFTFRAFDGLATSVPATVSIIVDPVNDPPVATPQTVVTNEDGSVAIVLSGSDVEGSALRYTVVTQPTKGVLSGTPPNLTYRPNANVNGADSFTFRVNDNTVNSVVDATVGISITPVNDPPVATPQTVVTNEDGSVAIVLSGSDVEGSALRYTVVTQPTKGVLSGTPPNLTYRPNANVNGADSFTFRVNDNTANSVADATVGISITPVNDPPVATPLSVSTRIETAVAIKLAGTDVDDNSTLTFEVVGQPANGTLSGIPPNLSYLPKAGYTGNDSFTYRARDGIANSAVNAVVSINVSNANRAPLAQPKSTNTLKGKAVAVVLSGSDADGNPLSYRITEAPANGTLVGTPPMLRYVPNAGWSGEDSFKYVANDGVADSAAATVRVKVKVSNGMPLATGRSLVVNWNVASAVLLGGSDPDADPLEFFVLARPLFGTLSGTPPNLTYTPNSGFRGKDRFTFRVRDGIAFSTPAVVELSVINPNNRAPIAVARSLSGPVGKPVAIALQASDADGDPLSYRVVTRPTAGKLLGKAPNLVFRPQRGSSGQFTFTYLASDGFLDSAPVTVTVNIVPAPEPANRSTPATRIASEAARSAMTLSPLPSLSLGSDPARPGVLSLSATGSPGERYILETSPDLSRWSGDQEVILDGSGRARIELTKPLGVGCGFYRLRQP